MGKREGGRLRFRACRQRIFTCLLLYPVACEKSRTEAGRGAEKAAGRKRGDGGRRARKRIRMHGGQGEAAGEAKFPASLRLAREKRLLPSAVLPSGGSTFRPDSGMVRAKEMP